MTAPKFIQIHAVNGELVFLPGDEEAKDFVWDVGTACQLLSNGLTTTISNTPDMRDRLQDRWIMQKATEGE